jgi:hypothetical protein
MTKQDDALIIRLSFSPCIFGTDGVAWGRAIGLFGAFFFTFFLAWFARGYYDLRGLEGMIPLFL